MPLTLVAVPFFVGSAVCLLAGAYAGCFLFDAAVDRAVKSLGLTREVLAFAVARIRKRKGMPAPVWADDCRETLRVLLEMVDNATFESGVTSPQLDAVATARRLLGGETPA